MAFIWLATMVVLVGSQAQGQAIDPRVLEQLQRQAETRGLSRPAVPPVDSSRQAAGEEGREAGLEQGLGTRLKVARAPLPPSALEKDFRSRLDEPGLSQFGYDIFEDYGARQRSLIGRLGDDYILGVGDEVIAVFQGADELTTTTRIDSEGRLILGKLPPIEAAGRRFAEVRDEVAARTAQTLIGTEAYVSIGAIKLIDVQVVGEVANPGVHQLTGLSDAVQALIAAGGVKKTGSLRRIRVLRGDKTLTVDLYAVLTGVGNVNARLRDGDRLVVPPIGDAIAVTGAVLRPGIFELDEGLGEVSVADALAMAGGPLRPRGNGLVLNRVDQRGDEIFSTIEDEKTRLRAADALVVVTRGGRRRDRVELAGHVFSPGPRALDTVPTVRALFSNAATTKPEPYLPFAALRRMNPVNRGFNYQAVNLLGVMTGESDIPLQGEDKLIVLSQQDIDFLSSDALRAVILGQPNPLPQCRALEVLARLIADVQTQRFAGVVRGVFLIEKEGHAQQAAVTAAATQTSLGAEGVAGLRAREGEAAGQSASGDASRNERQCPPVFADNEDLLPFVLEHVVTISGAVRHPGVLPVAGALDIASLIELSGGFAREAISSAVEIIDLKFDAERGLVDAERRMVERAATPFEDVPVRPGSSLRVQSVADDQEPGAVLLTGEFRRPGTYTIQRGETLGQLIARAGGLTEQAYPYGAVFTRRSVQQAQQAGFRRAARELNAALAVAALKKNVDAEAVRAAQQLSVSFATTEAPGRIVVEADPRVLALRQDLDLVLEPGDTVFMPKRPNHVLAIGDVLNPGALQFIRGKRVASYIGEAGGLQTSADDGRIFLVYPNGVAQPIRLSAWRRASYKVPPGSTIVVPKDTDPLAALDLTRDITTILSQLALSAASFAVIAR
ncbi:MAG: SLBB domain-containing protein [Pseudomonadota bacterium]